MIAVTCRIKSVEAVKDRDKKNAIWAYHVDLAILSKSHGPTNRYTMRIPPYHFKILNKDKEFRPGVLVKVIEHDRSVCAIFNSKGLGFMFVNIPFEIGE